MLSTAISRNNAKFKGAGRHWETPLWLFNKLDAEFHFTLDPCATPATAKCPLFYTEADDGLSKDWTGHRVFMNPPYGREIPPWTRKARDSGTLVVGLLPASTDLAWWHEDVLGHADVRCLRKRPSFLVNGRYRQAFMPTVVVVWSPKC